MEAFWRATDMKVPKANNPKKYRWRGRVMEEWFEDTNIEMFCQHGWLEPKWLRINMVIYILFIYV